MNTYTNSANNNLGYTEILLLFGGLHEGVRGVLRPEEIRIMRMSNAPISRGVVGNADICLTTCFVLIILDVLLVSISGGPLMAGLSTILSYFGGVNPNLRVIKPAKGFDSCDTFSGLILVFSVLTNELRVFPVLTLVSENT